MTNETNIGGTALMPTSSSHDLRSNDNNVKKEKVTTTTTGSGNIDETTTGLVIMNEKEKFMDEEITSEEEEDSVAMIHDMINGDDNSAFDDIKEGSDDDNKKMADEKINNVKMNDNVGDAKAHDKDCGMLDATNENKTDALDGKGNATVKSEHDSGVTESTIIKSESTESSSDTGKPVTTPLHVALTTNVPSTRLRPKAKPRQTRSAAVTRSAAKKPEPPTIPPPSVPNPLALIPTANNDNNNNEWTGPLKAAYDEARPPITKSAIQQSDTVVPNTTQSHAAIKEEPAVDKRRVAFTEPEPTRMRGFSIDIDFGMDFLEDGSVPGASDGDNGDVCRGRAFSFECFAFGINADEPLPPIDSSSSSAINQTGQDDSHNNSSDFHMGRPRGDSIIFDPCSFQEGGIHEQTALERGRLRSIDNSNNNITNSANLKKSRQTDASAITTTVNKNFHNSSIISAVPNSTSSMAACATTCLATSIDMGLINKDGRIGVYLPEDRRARIARFHAKRSKRIWRKRIKYDCRKKLADSRPRIKGRFVKRANNEDE